MKSLKILMAFTEDLAARAFETQRAFSHTSCECEHKVPEITRLEAHSQ